LIISGNSDADLLVDSSNNGGLQNYFQSLNFSGNCLGVTIGDRHSANLGDGNGFHNETADMRYNYGDPQLGTCKESEIGGNHFRYWIQNGSNADSGAIFVSASYEMPAAESHNIVVNGYNLGRDLIIGNISGSSVDGTLLTNSSTFSGKSIANNYTYQTDVTYVWGLLPNTSVDINHNTTVAVNGNTAVDGWVAVLGVTITAKPSTKGSPNSSGAIILAQKWPTHFLLTIFIATLLPLASTLSL